MYDRVGLTKQLKELGVKKSGTLFVHSSVKSVGAVDGGADTILDALLDAVGEDGLLCCATHTWDKVGSETDTFDPKNTPSCVGVLGMVLLKRDGAVRSLHPTHSMAVYGKGAKEFVEGEQYMHTPCPREGCCGKLLDADAQVLFLGVPLTKNTFIHGVEEWCGIENRLSEPRKMRIVMDDGTLFDASFAMHRAPVPDVSRNYGKLLPVFRKEGIAHEGKVGDADCVLCGCMDMFEVTSGLLADFPDLFLDNQPV